MAAGFARVARWQKGQGEGGQVQECDYLGCLPLEDRNALLMALVSELSPRRTVISKIAVSSFTATTTHALLFLLSRAGPRMSIRLLRDEEGLFTMDYAAQ